MRDRSKLSPVRRRRRVAVFAASVGLVAMLGATALFVTNESGRRVEDVHRMDRVALQRVLGSLTGQYVQFALGELAAAAKQPADLTPGSAAEQQALDGWVRSSSLFGHGAALLDLKGRAIATSSIADLPAPADPGLGPLLAALAAGQPGASAVMRAGDVPVVALGVPVLRAEAPVALLVGYFRADASPLQGYVESLRRDHGLLGYVLDANGVAIAAHDPALVGRPYPGVAGPRPGDGTPALVELERDGTEQVLSQAPVGSTGWTSATEEAATDFYGVLREQQSRSAASIVALLVVAVVVAAALAFKRELALSRLAHGAFHDALTGLPNRVLFRSKLDSALRQSDRDQAVAVIYVDLDRFKVVNDTFGHDLGDELLVAVGERLRGAVRDTDTVARLGGDEFTILLDGVSSTAEAEVVARRLHEALDAPLSLPSGPVKVRASIGIAVARGPHEDADAMLRDADLAMYHAKERRTGTHRSDDARPATRLLRVDTDGELFDPVAVGAGERRPD